MYGEKLNDRERQRIIRNLFMNFGRNIVDVFRMKKYYHRQIRDLIEVEGLENFDAAYRRGRGVLGITGHIGNFELLAAFFADSGYKVAVIGREMYDRRLNDLLVENRSALGEANIDTQDSPRRALKFLKEGYVIGVLMDIDSMRVRSEFVPFMGKPARTPVGQSILGLKTGAGFVPVACVRQGKRYKIIIKPEIKIDRTNDFNRDVYNITKRCSEALEEIIHEYKDQWIWIHDRWLTRPEGEDT